MQVTCHDNTRQCRVIRNKLNLKEFIYEHARMDEVADNRPLSPFRGVVIRL